MTQPKDKLRRSPTSPLPLPRWQKKLHGQQPGPALILFFSSGIRVGLLGIPLIFTADYLRKYLEKNRQRG